MHWYPLITNVISFVAQREKRRHDIPRLLLQNQMGLDKELDAQPQSTGCHIVHLLADAVSQIQPQVLSFAACKLQPKVVHFNYAQLSANLERDERKLVAKVDGGKGSAVWQQLWGNSRSRQEEALRVLLKIIFLFRAGDYNVKRGSYHIEFWQGSRVRLFRLHMPSGATKERLSLDALVRSNLAEEIYYIEYLYHGLLTFLCCD